jgi:uncharacterized membrane protein HdeD (DUF308 family)
MDNTFKTNRLDSTLLSKHRGWFLLWGALLVILGLLAITGTLLTTLITVVFLGTLLLIGGVIMIVDSVVFWWRRWDGFFPRLIMGILYTIAGLMLIEQPVLSSISITLVLGVFYIVLGLLRLADSFSTRAPQWGWSFFSGLIALLLGILILTNWPASGLYIIGLFIGIDLVFCGWAFVIASIAARPSSLKTKDDFSL